MPSTDLPTLLLAHWPRVVLALLAAGTAGVLLAGGVEAEAGVDISADPPLPAVATDPAEFAAVPDLEVAVSAEGPVVEELEGAARRHGLDPDLLKAVAWVESSFRPDAVSAAGAVGSCS